MNDKQFDIEYIKDLLYYVKLETSGYINEYAFLSLPLYFQLGKLNYGYLKSIIDDWNKYYCRSDINLEEYNLCNRNDINKLKNHVINFSSLNKALSIPLYSDGSIRKRFHSPLVDHELFTIHDFEWDFKKEIKNSKNLSRFSNLIDFYLDEHKSSKVEVAFMITSLGLRYNIPPLTNAIRTIIYAWGKYYQRSDMAINDKIGMQADEVYAFRNMNVAFEIPIHTKGRVRKEFYSEMVYKTLASLHKQGITINNDVHKFIGRKYGFSEGTSKNYYSYLLAKGAPSVSGRLKITNKRSGLEIPFSLVAKDLTEFLKFKNGKI